MKNLNVLFLWHMHQPLYHVTEEEPLRMPWVRLHGLKDYLGMAQIVSESEDYRMTFNFTPVLWDQIRSYSNGIYDRELNISVKSAASLSIDERRFLLAKMFTGNPDSLIKPYPRYVELFQRFGAGGENAAHRMNESDIIDLVVWRILAWIHPDIQNSNPVFYQMVNKERNYSEDDKALLIKESLKVLGTIPEVYKRLYSSKRIDLTTTPYYHPILPLIIDSKTALNSAGMKGSFPKPFAFYDDADWHLAAAINEHESLFERVPEGIWPAEGSVSQQAAELFSKHKIKWIASDEAIIQKSMEIAVMRDDDGVVTNPDLLYKPAQLQTEEGSVFVFFRDHLLSDLIGFDYQSFEPERAADDFLDRLCKIRDSVQDLEGEHCVSVILDGENAWEHYPDGGFPFLKHLFRKISNCNGLILNTFSDYLRNNDNLNPHQIDHLKAGSWIDGDFGIWIGQKEENIAWSYLSDAFSVISPDNNDISSSDLKEAKKYLRAAQGSDSFWWFGDIHYTAEKSEFDAIFRELLIQAYKTAGVPIPRYLYQPISPDTSKVGRPVYPTNLISPKIDGEIRSYYDWFGSGVSEFGGSLSSMHHGQSVSKYFKCVRFGFDLQFLYLRLDPEADVFSDEMTPSELTVLLVFNDTTYPSDLEFHFVLNGSSYDCNSIVFGQKCFEVDQIKVAFKQILEISVPFKFIRMKSDQKVSFHVEIFIEGRYAGRSPERFEIEFFRPTEDYDNILWRV